MNPVVTEAIRLFLDRRKTAFSADLIARYHPGMECQVIVRPGEPIDKGANLFSEDGITWYPIRVPKKADTEPVWKDYPLQFPLSEYATDIGMSGWNWQQRVSRGVGFDLDTILGDHPGGLTPAQLEEIRAALAALPYVELRRSTQGQGIHVYVFLADIPTENHTVHAVLAKAALAKISADTGRDFAADVDCFGAILYCWSNRASEEKRSYELLKPSTQVLTEADLPGWRNAVLPPRTRRHQANSDAGDEDALDVWDELSSSFPVVQKDAEHSRVLEEYQARGWPLLWLPEHNCYRAHTAGLAEVFEALKLRGIFKTVSPGTDKTRCNCYLYLRPNGAFFVIRYGKNGKITEAPCWSRTVNGKPCIVFNDLPDVRTACLTAGGVDGDGIFTFAHVAQAKEAALALGFQLPDLEDRQLNFAVERGRLIVTAERQKKETPAGWAATARKLSVSFVLPETGSVEYEYDHIVRHLRNNDDGIDKDGGFLVKGENGRWCPVSDGRAISVLMGTGMSKTEAQATIGTIGRQAWYEVNEPLGDEYQPNRQWNMRGAKLRFSPVEPGPTPTWDRVFDHCGLGLDEAVAADPWCREHGIETGGDYLRWYTAAVIRFPKRKLPYLFFVSEGEFGQETGKSTYARANNLLFARGSVNAKQALAEKFNLQLAGAVYCWLEEAALSQEAYLRIKEWVDAPRMTIRAMRRDGYSLPNYCHFNQSGNKQSNCPIELGDTRVVVAEVPPLDPKDWLDWDTQLVPALEREAPEFLGRLYALPLPETGFKRLYLPVLTTRAKQTMLEAKRRESEEREGRKTLLTATLGLAKRGRWEGTAGELILALGKSHGEWSSIETYFGRQLHKIIPDLRKHGVTVSFPRSGDQRRILVEGKTP